MYVSGALNDLNTLKTLFRLPRVLRSLEMHSKRRYKICTCSVKLGELESFRKYKGFSIISRKFRWNLTYCESDNFCDSSLHHIFESESFRHPFLYEK